PPPLSSAPAGVPRLRRATVVRRDPLELSQEIARRLPAFLRIFGKSARDELGEQRRGRRLQRSKRRRLVRESPRSGSPDFFTRTAFARRSFRTPARQTRRCRAARRPPRPRVAPATCTAACPESSPSSSGESSSWASSNRRG